MACTGSRVTGKVRATRLLRLLSYEASLNATRPVLVLIVLESTVAMQYMTEIIPSSMYVDDEGALPIDMFVIYGLLVAL